MVPVLPKGELEVLLEAAIDLSKKGKCITRHAFTSSSKTFILLL